MDDPEIIEALKKLELTEGEAKVYLSLLAGESTKSGIVRKSGISSSIVYDVLKKLTKKGLVSSIIIEGKRHFRASDPEILLGKLEDKRVITEDLVSILKRRKRESILFVQMYEGLEGLKSILKEVEKTEFEKNKTKEWLAMGVTSYKKESFNRFWINWHNNVRPKYKIKARFIFSEKDTNYVKMIRKTPLSRVRYVHLSTPSCVTIVGESVLIMKYAELPSFILLKNKDVANTFKEIFKFLWKNC
jgi:predicted DNA-binding transcriptional regulator